MAQDSPAIQGHPAQLLYTDHACGDVIKVLDSTPNPAIGIEAMMLDVANQGMIWGILLGYELANPGLRGNHDTVLKRLRDACEHQPDQTTVDLLTGFERQAQ